MPPAAPVAVTPDQIRERLTAHAHHLAGLSPYVYGPVQQAWTSTRTLVEQAAAHAPDLPLAVADLTVAATGASEELLPLSVEGGPWYDTSRELIRLCRQLVNAARDALARRCLMNERAEYIAGLRALADLLERHSEVPLPHHGQRLGGSHIVEELIFIDGPSAVATALTLIGAMDQPPTILVEDGVHHPIRITGHLRGYHVQLCVRTGDTPPEAPVALEIPAELRNACALLAGA
ncbi:hypothetical protein [Spongiactinospora sp. TRM90649]|uniref:hypothetical protein n=1 Tax=Spongiactinospora sp. TRM90649 TaxID=3031114 RepID=UPI0023F7D2EA|nr:hypothetical protein [Spongiactinospora sp. TRM90649]MDF5758559.1 hypothetical protein [Spongiactinospora sp. TRM90649]